MLDFIFIELDKESSRVLVVFDGFDYVLGGANLTRNLWDQLRALAQKPSLRLIAASRRPLSEVCRTEESRTSDFWAIFNPTPLRVAALDDVDLEAFMQPLLDSGHTLDGSARKEIANWTGGVPLLVGALLRRLWETHQETSSLSKPDVDEAAAAMLDEQRDLLAALWDDCGVELMGDLASLAAADVPRVDLSDRRVRAIEDRGWVRLFFVEKFLPYSWAFLPADASLQCSFRGDSNQASAYPRLSGGQPSLETVPNTVGLSPSGALPSGHSRGVLVRFHGQGDRPVMAVTTGFQGRRFDVPEARTGVPRIDLPSPAPCAAADAVFADAKAFLSSNEARQMSESELERELHRRGQELVRKLLQGHRDQRSPKEAAGPAEDTSGVECSEPHEHESHAETTSGTMQVVGLGCARRGHDGLHRLDAALNRLPERYLVEMRRRVTIATASRAPPRTPWKPQWYSTLSTWQRRCGVRCSSPAH